MDRGGGTGGLGDFSHPNDHWSRGWTPLLKMFLNFCFCFWIFEKFPLSVPALQLFGSAAAEYGLRYHVRGTELCLVWRWFGLVVLCLYMETTPVWWYQCSPVVVEWWGGSDRGTSVWSGGGGLSPRGPESHGWSSHSGLSHLFTAGNEVSRLLKRSRLSLIKTFAKWTIASYMSRW